MTLSEQGAKQPFPLPKVAEALKPFIKTRQEALRIRRVLSLYLASQIEGLPNGNPSPLSLATQEEGIHVKEIPNEIKGLRRDYLLALQANVRAKEEYARAADKCGGRSSRKGPGGAPPGERDSSAMVSTYLDLFEARQEHAKLRILQDYADVLAKKDAAQPEYFTPESIVNEIGTAPGLASTWEHDTTDQVGKGEDVQVQITRLEKALLRASISLQREKKLLAEAKEKYRNIASDTSKGPNQNARNYALSRTRDELVSWMEEQLSKIKDTEDGSEVHAYRDPEKDASIIEQRKVVIQRLYNDYLDVRKTLIALASKPRSVHNVEDLRVQGVKTAKIAEQGPPTADFGAATALPYITEHLIPAVDTQQALLQQESYISKALSDQNRTTEKMLNRLADESHLLANYPLLAAQPRFKKAAAALGGPKLQPSPLGDTEDSQEESTLVQRGRAWAFAADAAKAAQDEALERKLYHGEEHAEAAKSTLKELQNLLNGSRNSNEDDEGDIWVEETQSKASRKKDSCWIGLDGKIGVDLRNT